MNPRLSISGRMSIDGWNGVGNTPIGGGTTPTSGHARRGSGRQTLFNALDEDDDGIDAVGLERLPEVDEEDEFESNERTHLQSQNRHSGSRSGSNSPRAGTPGDPRRNPR